MRNHPLRSQGNTRGLRDRWVRLLLALLLLAGLVFLAFLFLFRGYLVDTQQGREFRLPLLAGEAGIPVFSQGDIPPQGEREAPEPLHAVLLPLEAAEGKRGAAALRARGGNAAILDMKEESGALHYVSSLPEAIEARVSAADPAQNERLREFIALSPYSIARVSAFRDDALAQARPAWSLLRVSGSPWRDEARLAWLSPASAGAQDYLLGVCRELRELGFDEVLLSNCAYPSAGRQDLLADTTARSAAARRSELEHFYTRLRELSAETGLRISVHWLPCAADFDGLPVSGQSLADAAAAFHRTFFENDPEKGAGIAPADARLMENISFVSVVSDKIESKTAWAIF